MSINDVILWLMAAFAAVGAADRILGNRWGLGEKFEEGILAIGPLALSMWGAICIAPALADVLYPVVAPVFRMLGADPGMFPGCILACDMGGAPLAAAMAQDANAGLFGGVMIGSMLGVTIVFTIPVSLNMAFAVSAAFVFGDHLGFTAGYAPELLFPVIVAKLVGGVTAVALAWFMTRERKHASDLP